MGSEQKWKLNIMDENQVFSLLIDEIEEHRKVALDKITNYQQILTNLDIEKHQLDHILGTNINFFSPKESTQLNRRKELEKEEYEIGIKLQDLQNKVASMDERINELKKIGKKYTEFIKIYEKNQTVLMNNKLYGGHIGLGVLETQEFERKRIARELHDSTVQNLTNFVHKTELCLKLVDMDTVRVKLELRSMIDSIRETINDMRSIIYDLRPMSLDDLGLVVTVERYIDQLRSTTENIDFQLKVMEKEVFLPSVVTLTLFRVIQEACNNAIKYSKASTILVYIYYGLEDIEIEVKDNGIGFDDKNDKNSTEMNSGFGLSIMKERIYLLSGNIKIESTIDIGTTVKVKVPYITMDNGEIKNDANKNSNSR